jgi:hypothetical protein
LRASAASALRSASAVFSSTGSPALAAAAVAEDAEPDCVKFDEQPGTGSVA